jgi:hypothetical protein
MDQSLARGAFCTLALSAAAAVVPVPRLSLSSPPGPAAAFAQPVSPPSVAAAPALATYRPTPSVTITDDVEAARPIPVPKPTPTYSPPAPSSAPAATPYPSYTPLPPRQTAVAVSGSPRDYAESLVGAAQFACLDPLWDRESGWNPYAQNPSSGAYGIPQALPGSKMASAGADWATNGDTQVRWGVELYIDPVYGSACNALAHENKYGWY